MQISRERNTGHRGAVARPLRLSDLCEFIVDCEHKTAPTQADGYPSIRTPNIGRGRLILEGVNRVSEEVYREWTRRAEPRPGDLILAREAPVGNVAVVPPGFKVCLGQRTVLIRPDQGKANSVYLTYTLLGDEIRGHILGLTTGATVGHLNVADIRTLPIPALPPVPVQCRVAGILSSYDDLIENNTKRIKILEEMARSLYREWFVNFRFPGHNKAKFVKSALGQIPEGWRVARMGEITTKIGSGATPKGGEAAYRDTGVTLIRSMNVYDAGFSDDGLAFLDDDQAEGLANVTVESRDILLNITGASVARCCMVPDRHLPARVNQHVMIIRANPSLCDPHFLLASINSEQRKQQLLSYAEGSGATRQALTKETVSNFQIVLPSQTLLAQFGSFAREVALQREVLVKQNQNLRATRDLLLPRLISGEIDVSSLPLEPAAS